MCLCAWAIHISHALSFIHNLFWLDFLLELCTPTRHKNSCELRKKRWDKNNILTFWEATQWLKRTKYISTFLAFSSVLVVNVKQNVSLVCNGNSIDISRRSLMEFLDTTAPLLLDSTLPALQSLELDIKRHTNTNIQKKIGNQTNEKKTVF